MLFWRYLWGLFMGFFDSVKDLYYQAEEKYYSVLDRIDEKIPVYKIIDPIDKVVPSFALFLAIIVLLVLGGAWLVFSGFLAPQTTTLTIAVKTPDNLPVVGADVKYTIGGEEKTKQTNENGEIEIGGLARETQLSIEVSAPSYPVKIQTITITSFPKQVEEITLEEEQEELIEKTIRVVDETGAGIRENLTLRFTCTSIYAQSPPDKTLTPQDNGVAVIQVSSACERLIVSVDDGSRFEGVSSTEVTLDPSEAKIILSEADLQRGGITARLVSSSGEVVRDEIQVLLFRYEETLSNPNVGPIDREVTDSGTVSFSVSPGNYIVRTSPTPQFSEGESGRVNIGAGEEKTVEVTLEENVVQGKIKVKVVDSGSHQAIARATVTLKEQETAKVLETRETTQQDEGMVEFNVAKDVLYEVIAEASGYELTKRQNLRISDSVTEIGLDPCTPTTCGNLKVKVVDQDGEPIENATVALYDADDGFLAGFENKPSDENGVAVFNAVPSGSYFAFAFKETTEGRSDTKFFSTTAAKADEFDLVVTINVPNGIVKATIVDNEQRPIPFAVVSVFDARNNELLGSAFSNASGVFELPTKANKRVYLKVSQKSTTPKFADYFTVERPVIGDSVQEFLVKLEPEIISKNIEAEFLGLFKDDLQATVLSAGEKYVGKFRLRVPEQKAYRQAGMHVRTGTDALMEKDPLFLKKINAPTAQIVRATRFDSNSNLAEQNYKLTNSDAKWANIVWGSPSAGIYEVEAEMQVKETASVQEQLKVFWRAFAQDGVRERHPQDDTVTIELYSEAFSRIYEVGVTTLCDESFCFSARIRDKEQALTESVIETYTARNLKEYELKFTLLNNSDTRIHNNANLRIRNPEENLLFTDYTIIDAQTRETKGVLNGNDFNRFDVGAFNPKNKLEFTTSFFTEASGDAAVNIRLVSDERIVYEKNILITITAPKKMEVLVEPSFYASGIQTDINALVTDAETKLEIEGVIARLVDKHDNVIQTTLTGKDGYAYLTLPAQKPGTRLFIEFEKPQYEKLVHEISISGDLVELTPKELGFALNAKTKFEDSQKITVSNVTQLPLVIRKIKLNGKFKNLVDLKATQDLLDFSYKDFDVEAMDSKELNIRVLLSQEGKGISQRQELEGELSLEIENFGKNWQFSVPVKITIGLEGEVDDPTCLKISKKEWVTTTQGDPARTEFVLENNCVIDGKPVELKKLVGKAMWESNELGRFDVTIGETKTELRSGYDKGILSRLLPEQSVTMLVTFTPYAGVNGEAKAKLVFSASNVGEEQEQGLTNELSATITIVNLKDCISIEPAVISIEKTETEKSFTVNVGTANIKCGVGVDFEVESPLDINPKKFSLADGATKEVLVFRGDPLAGDVIQGQYPVFIRGKFANQQQEQFLQLVRVRIYEEGCIQLSRYEFDVYKDPENELSGFDTAVLTNQCFDKQVPIRVNTKDLTSAMKTGSTFGLIAFAVSILGHGLEGLTGGGGLFGGGNSNDPTKGLSKEQIEQGTYSYNGKTYFNKDNEWWEKDGSKYERTFDPRPNQTTTRTPTTSARQAPSQPAQPINPPGGVSTHPNVILNVLSAPLENSSSPKSNLQKTVDTVDVLSGGSFPAITGLQGLFGGGASGGGGLTGGLFGAATSVLDGITGTKNPLMQGLQVFLIATLVDYLGQEDEARFITTQRDVEIDVIAIQNPGEEIQGLDRFVAKGVATHVAERKILNKIPDKLKFLAPLVLSKNVNLLAPDFDKDIKVQQEVKPAFKALPIDGFDQALAPMLFGDRTDQTIPNVSLLSGLGSQNKRMERRGIIFINKSEFTTKPEDPKYKVLRVMGIRHFYKDKEYDKDEFEIENKKGWFSFGGSDEIIDPTTGELEELPSELVDERFRLEFNAVPPEEDPNPTERPLLNCQDAFRTGSTGTQALPKVMLSWKWGDIESGTCDTENEDAVFCDATQFSIAVLKKIEALKTFLESRGSTLECPSPLNFRSNTSTIPNVDVGISEIGLEKVRNDAKITVTIKNTNPQPVTTDLRLVLVSAATGQVISGTECVNENVQVLSEEKVECEFSGLANGNYAAEATIEPTIDCVNCEDKSASNFLNINFTIGDTGVEECEPFSTARLSDFLAASGISGEEANGVLKNVTFQANLIQDRFSADFQKDFDMHSKTESFFEAPNSYTDERTGLGNYFRDPQLFSFKPDFADADPEGYLVPGAGKYNVTIDITFEDDTWKLFDEDGTNAKISVLLERAGEPETPSPFYDLPFDGFVGSDGRTNYGLNFEGDTIVVNGGNNQLKTLALPNSTPVKNLAVNRDESFKRLNNDERGVVMQVFGGENPRLVYSPSYATPVILKMSNDIGEAWAFYSVEVNNGALDTGPQLSEWNGVGFNCKAFDDRFMSEYFFTPDMHGLDEFRSCARVPGELEKTSYGFEFCDTKKFGSMFMQSVFFSPQDTTTVLKMNVAQKEAEFLTPSTQGTTVALDNKVLGGKIETMQDVFNLVKSEYVCVSSEAGRTDFWWNPKKIFELNDRQFDQAISQCILK